MGWRESVESRAVREAKEETSLDVTLRDLFPRRDPRHHTVTTVFIASASGAPCAADDAKDAGVFRSETLPRPLVFDHHQILADYFRYRSGEAKTGIFRTRLTP